MMRLLTLEAFDSPPDLPEPEPAGPSDDWLDGHATGVAEGLSRAAAETDARLAEIAQSLADISFGFAEARAAVLASLGPLFSTLADRLLPGLAAQAQRAALIEAATAAARADSAAPLDIRVHPALADQIAAVVPDLPDLPFTIRADPGVAPGQILVSHRSQDTLLDAEALIAALAAPLAFLRDEPQRKAGHD